MRDGKKIKERIYTIVAHTGIWIMGKFFPEYFAVEPLRPTDRYLEYPFVLSNLPKSPCKILDVGCSGSMFPLILKAIGYETYGIDIREYSPQDKFIFYKEDIRTFSVFHNDTFNVITAVSSMEHIGLRGRYGQYEDIFGDKRAITEIHRILNPDGYLLLTVPFDTAKRITYNHRIYDKKSIENLLDKFTINLMEVVQSPEAEYKIAMIKAVKNE